MSFFTFPDNLIAIKSSSNYNWSLFEIFEFILVPIRIVFPEGTQIEYIFKLKLKYIFIYIM